jgi:hypothetical protein
MHHLLLRIVFRLRHCVRPIQEKSHDFFEDLVADIHSAVKAIGRFYPIHFADSNLPRLSFSAVAELDVEQIAAQDHSQTMKGIAMPRRRFPRRQPLSPNQVISAMMQHLLISERFHIDFPSDASSTS